MDVNGATTEPVAQEPIERPTAELGELAQLADALVEEIATARSHYDELRAALDAQDPELLDEAHWGTLAADAAAPAQAEATAELPAADGHAPAETAEDETSPLEKARLSALSLALTGGTREDACSHLRESFDLDFPEDIVDEVFGSPPVAAPDSAAPRKRRFARRRRDR